jgi:LysM repeat protein
MNRRQLAFIIILNALISLAIALGVAWFIDARRPDPEELAALYPAAATAGSASLVVMTPSGGAPPTPADTATPPPAQPDPPTALAGEEQIHVVQAGESLSSIAERYGVGLSEIVAANNLQNPDFVFSGQRLRIPARGAVVNSSTTISQTTPAQDPASATQGIRIGKVDAPGDLAQEVTVIINDGSTAVNLQGWQLSRENGPAYSLGSVILFPGSSVRVITRAGTDSSVDFYWNQGAAVWQPGSVARLFNEQGQLVVSYTIP